MFDIYINKLALKIKKRSLTSLSSSNRHTYKGNDVKRCNLLINKYRRQFSVQKKTKDLP